MLSLQNNGKNILWSYLVKVFRDDVSGHLYCTKLTHDHVNLTPASTMSVRLAAQITLFHLMNWIQNHLELLKCFPSVQYYQLIMFVNHEGTVLELFIKKCVDSTFK